MYALPGPESCDLSDESVIDPVSYFADMMATRSECSILYCGCNKKAEIASG